MPARHSDNYLMERLNTQNLNDITKILNDYRATIVYQDDFSDGEFHGWQYQYDSNNRVGITLDDVAMTGNYSMLLHTRPAASDQAWARKGHMVPAGVKKILIGCYWMFHAANVNNPATLNFDFDMQQGSGGSHRRYIRFQYQNHDGTTLQTRWRVNTGTPTSQAFTVVPSGTMNIAWNESDKPLLNWMVGVYDLANQKYEALYANGNYYDLTKDSAGNATTLAPTAGTDLTNYDGGAIQLFIEENRSNSSEDCLFWIEKPTLGFVYG